MEIFTDKYWMGEAIKLAKRAHEEGEIPVGAVLVQDDKIIGKGYNQVERLNDPTAHAEMIAITSGADYLENWRLDKAVLYVTKEPCIMCAGAILNSRVKKVVFGFTDNECGAGGSRWDIMREHPRQFVEIHVGVRKDECLYVFSQGFEKMRLKKDE